MRRRSIADVAEPIEFLMSETQVQEHEPEQQRKTKRQPHERERAARQLNVTFPEPEWTDAVRDLAERWNVRPADVMVVAFAYLMRAIEDGEVRRPQGEQRFYHRAGECFELPWGPGEG